MIDKEKQIEEMKNNARIYIGAVVEKLRMDGCELYEIDGIVENILNYITIPEDSVVLSRGEYERVKYVLKYEPEEAIIRLEDLAKNERLYSPHMFCSLGGCSGVSKGCNRTCKESWIVIERKETAREIFDKIIWFAVKLIGKTSGDSYYQISFDRLNELAKQFGVEVKNV